MKMIKNLDKAIMIQYMIEELEKKRQQMLDKLGLKDFFTFAYETGYTEKSPVKTHRNELYEQTAKMILPTSICKIGEL